MAVLAGLIGALQRDGSAAVRSAAADVLGGIKPYSTQAGLALERAADADAAAAVRAAAREALWAYHVNGYRSRKIAELVAGQTAEPPLARPRAVRPAGAFVPPVVARPAAAPPPFVPNALGLPPLVRPPGPMARPEAAAAAKPPPLMLRPAFPPNRTAEPPLARRRPAPVLSPSG